MIPVAYYTQNWRHPVGYIVCRLLSIASETIYSHKVAHGAIENVKTSHNSRTCLADIVVTPTPYSFPASTVKS